MKRIILIGLSALLMFAGLVVISCKGDSNDSKETKTSVTLDDSLFVELSVRQSLLIQEYSFKAQQVKSDSEMAVLTNEFNEKTGKILSTHGVSPEQLKNYFDEMSSDTQKLKELREEIIKRTEELIVEESKAKSQ